MKRPRSRVADALADWIPLVDPSGPFLTLPVLRRAFPNGLERSSPDVRSEMRQRLEVLSNEKAERAVWLRWVLRDLLEYGELLKEGPAIPDSLQHTVPEQGVTLRPDFALLGPPEAGSPAGRARLLVEVYERGTDFTKRLPDQRWTATPIERMALLCRATGVELGLVTDADAFTLVWAKRNGSVATATWLTSLWSEERGVFDAFLSLLGARRFFAVGPADVLEALFAESATAQVEVTNQLGKQVRQAVELLVDAFSRANRESGGVLLEDLGAGDLETAAETMYSAAVTVMMRLVFLLCAEERRLFPVGDALYDASYAISTMLDALQEESSLYGEETLERRLAAWNRILATCRLVHDGVQHESLRIPAYGGSLFDPNRFPFLEGRRPGQAPGSATGVPPAITDRSVLAILNALQYLNFKGESRRVAYRSLDVEQIGHVYEGLLDHGCRIVDEILLGFAGKEEPELPLNEIEAMMGQGRQTLGQYIIEKTGRSLGASLTRDLERPIDADTRRALLESCEGDQALFERIAPFVGLMRRDLRGLPMVFQPGAVCMTQTSSRRDSGTEYTTRELADEVVKYALEPLVYSPGAQDGVPSSEWRLKSAKDILALRVCDPAVGSGAILVAACRYLADRLAEAWTVEGSAPGEAIGGPDALAIASLRSVVDHCLYGVDRNPMAVEMAKLSLWLVTMAKERPFSFLDHAIQSGDSLVGLTSIEQLTTFHLDQARGKQARDDLFGHAELVRSAVAAALHRLHEMAAVRVLTVRDVEYKSLLHQAARLDLSMLTGIADLLVGAALETESEGDALSDRLESLSTIVSTALNELRAGAAGSAWREINLESQRSLVAATPKSAKVPRPLHWILSFPEVFLGDADRTGFDAIVGNPPFLGGLRIASTSGGAYRGLLVRHIAAGRRGLADLSAYFFLRAARLLRQGGNIGFLATNTIAQGETREVGLDWLLSNGFVVYRAVSSRPWPGRASLEIAQLWISSDPWTASATLDGLPVDAITSLLKRRTRVEGNPQPLAATRGRAFIGTYVLGEGFTLSPAEANDLISRDDRNREVLFPYLGGGDVTSSPTHQPSRWVINFHDWPIERARQFKECFEIVERNVKPERAKNNDKARREIWWRFTRPTIDLYQALEGTSRTLVMVRVSKTMLPVFVETGSVYSDRLVVFAYEDDFSFGVLSSCTHWWWALAHGTTHETRPTYNPSKCFETFPMPPVSAAVESIAKSLDIRRVQLMTSASIGLTDTYNLFHSPEEKRAEVLSLREAHVALDGAVMAAYGWSDLKLQHDYYSTSQGVRLTIKPSTRDELLDRLLELNRRKFEEELNIGLHEPTSAKRLGRRLTRVVKGSHSSQGDLLEAPPSGSVPTEQS